MLKERLRQELIAKSKRMADDDDMIKVDDKAPRIDRKQQLQIERRPRKESSYFLHLWYLTLLCLFVIPLIRIIVDLFFFK